MKIIAYEVIGGPYNGKQVCVKENQDWFRVVELKSIGEKPEYVDHVYHLNGNPKAFHYKGSY